MGFPRSPLVSKIQVFAYFSNSLRLTLKHTHFPTFLTKPYDFFLNTKEHHLPFKRNCFHLTHMRSLLLFKVTWIFKSLSLKDSHLNVMLFSFLYIVPYVLKSCAEFIETHGIVDGIYRLSGVTSNIQRC